MENKNVYNVGHGVGFVFGFAVGLGIVSGLLMLASIVSTIYFIMKVFLT